ncbi:MAG: type III-A CRISPR-associated RAMP protein Csm4 [Anaerolineaceae bacterium]|nr:type III-A CRISPR-associated RAMP protein Csm4 [Anaerolineaceae bacterium]
MKTYSVFLHPQGSLASPISSDTIFGAVCWGIHILGGNPSEILTLEGPPRLAFSGTFPVRFVDKQPIRFFPRPLSFEISPDRIGGFIQNYAKKSGISVKSLSKEFIRHLKNLKEVEYISESLFFDIILGKLDPLDILNNWLGNKGDFKQTGDLLVGRLDSRGWPYDFDGNLHPLLKEGEVQHNQIDRLAGATSEGLLFYENETHFSLQGGLWFLLKAETADLEKIVMPAFRFLEDTGLGGNRTSGKGQFKFDVVESPILPDIGKEANSFMALSRYLPRQAEWKKDGFLAYSMVSLWPKREQKYPQLYSGKATEPIYKRRVRMFEPGSVFPLQNRQEFYGRLAELVPRENGANAVYQSGITIPVFLKINPKGE